MNQMGEELRIKDIEIEKLKDRCLELSQTVDSLLEINGIPNLDKAFKAIKNGEFFAIGGFNVIGNENLSDMINELPYYYNANSLVYSKDAWCISNDFGDCYRVEDYGTKWWLTEEEANQARKKVFKKYGFDPWWNE